MQVIIDAGSTKADWALLNDSKLIRKSTIGFNPITSDGQLFLEDYLRDPIAQASNVKEVHFYGAGCSTEKAILKTQTILKKIFPHSTIHVTTDLMGAALATSQNKPAIICLLGTGSNSCLFNGASIIDQIPNLGYILGDEGSGYAIGKALLKAYFYRALSTDLNVKFQDQYQLNRNTLIQNVYHSDTSNRVVAAFAKFADDNKQHDDIKKIIKSVFEEFIEHHVLKYQTTSSIPVHFVGSIAYIYRDRLEEILERQELLPGTFLRKPIEGLIDFHQKYKS